MQLSTIIAVFHAKLACSDIADDARTQSSLFLVCLLLVVLTSRCISCLHYLHDCYTNDPLVHTAYPSSAISHTTLEPLASSKHVVAPLQPAQGRNRIGGPRGPASLSSVSLVAHTA